MLGKLRYQACNNNSCFPPKRWKCGSRIRCS